MMYCSMLFAIAIRLMNLCKSSYSFAQTCRHQPLYRKSPEKLHSTDGTNSQLWALANASLQEGFVLLADYQNGRGQAGAGWFSDEGENLLLSVCHRLLFNRSTISS